jgi:hypothetical protein
MQTLSDVIQEMQAIADRYIMNDGFISDDTINLICEFLREICNGYDPELHLSVIKNVLEDAVDEAIELYA